MSRVKLDKQVGGAILERFDIADPINSVLNYDGFRDVDRVAILENIDYVVDVLKHINNVRYSFEILSELMRMGDYDYWLCRGIIEKHDEYKFSFSEFRGYAQWFYPDEAEGKNKDKMLKAWNHHQKHHPHHYQYWLLTEGLETKALRMPFPALVDMFCDWAAMSFEFNNKPSEWFNDNKKRMIFHADTEGDIEKLLDYVDETVEIMVQNKTAENN